MWREGEGCHRIVVPFEYPFQPAGRQGNEVTVPIPIRPISVSRYGEALAVRGERRGVENPFHPSSGRESEEADCLAGLNVPDTDGLIVRDRNQLPALLREQHLWHGGS